MRPARIVQGVKQIVCQGGDRVVGGLTNSPTFFRPISRTGRIGLSSLCAQRLRQRCGASRLSRADHGYLCAADRTLDDGIRAAESLDVIVSATGG